jgi:aminoglycoside phosphotransferase family enzyme
MVKHDVDEYMRVYLWLKDCMNYRIESQVYSPATRVIFTHDEQTNQRICLKLWRPCKNELYDTEDVAKCTEYLVEGLEFNRRFAPNVYLGITPVLSENALEIRCGHLIEEPEKSKLGLGKQYALVMKFLDEDWRLDQQLLQGELATEQAMDFLAIDVAKMHQQLEDSPKEMGMSKPNSIWSKLALNRNLFDEALTRLGHQSIEIEQYKLIGSLMNQAYEYYIPYFQERYNGDHIKRCHGDLKVTNLWVQPASPGCGRQLLALDCIDFNPVFCYIDTLSDVAMLAVDLEAHFLSRGEGQQAGRKLAEHFLSTYLQERGETGEAIEPLLKYYMVEKSMVCTYVGVLYKSEYENLAMLREIYLEVALTHAKELIKF